ncbi:MAG: DUF502 domain-containing protein [Puniceicoccales bacterium]|nr:DUF502 domain-containing protein [Puniceicoccales bacterium]
MFRSLRKSFISGLLTLLPLAVTAYVLILLVRLVGRPAGRILFRQWQTSMIGRAVTDLLAIVVVVGAIAVVGAVSRFFVGRWFIGCVERIIGRMPFVSMVYGSSKQIVGTFADGRRAPFRKAVLVHLPGAELGVIGFLTAEVKGELAVGGERAVTVLVPTTPNPTSGFLIIVPPDRCTELSLSIGDAMKIVISGGTYVPNAPKEEGEVDKFEG